MIPADDKTFRHERLAIARRMLAVIQNVKTAVDRFDDGEINLEDAVRQIADAVVVRKAA
jgi:hypothetical protein